MADDDEIRTGRRDDMEEPDDDVVVSAVAALQALDSGAKALKVVAGAGALLWAATFVTVFWNYWDMTRNDTGGNLVTGSFQNTRLLQVLGSTLTSSWGYAQVAVLAYVGSMVLHGQRLRLLVAAVSDD